MLTANLSDNDLLLLKTFQNDNLILPKFDFSDMKILKIEKLGRQKALPLAIKNEVTSLATPVAVKNRPMIKAARRKYALDRQIKSNYRLRGLKCLFIWNFQPCHSRENLKSVLKKSKFFEKYGDFTIQYHPGSSTCLIDFEQENAVDQILKSAGEILRDERRINGTVEYLLNLRIGGRIAGGRVDHFTFRGLLFLV